MPRRPALLAVLAGLVAALVPGAGATAQAPPPPIAPYLDVCSDAPARTDLRRLVFGVADDSTYGAIVEGCEAGGAADWDLTIALPDDSIRKVRVRTVGGATSFTVTDETTAVPVPLFAGNGQRRDDRSIQIRIPALVLAPIGEEMRFLVTTADDRLPDAGRPAVVYPSPCVGGTSNGVTVLRLDPDADSAAAVATAAGELGADVGTVDATLGAVEIEGADAATREQLAELPGVTGVEVAPPMAHLAVTPNDPYFPDQTGLRLVGAPTAWDTRTASGQRVAILDDGIDGTRTDLAGRVVAGYDVIRRQVIPAGADSDLGGHGTSVAGVVGARGNDAIGMAGTDWGAALVPIRVFDEMGCASSADVAVGIRAATDLGASVLNLSLGGPTGSGVLDDAVAYATAEDVLIVAAAGNSGPSTPAMHPAVHPDVVAVGATTFSDTIAPYSNQGDHIELTAPGGAGGDGILTLAERDLYAERTGTSFAAPIVAGAAALYRAQHPSASRSQVRAALAATAVDLGATGRDPVFGHGRLDMAALLPPGDPTPTGLDDPCAGATPAGFGDVTGGVHAANIDCLVHLGITEGVTRTRYGRELEVTRAQMATFLARLIRVAGGGLPTASPDAFGDDDGSVHEANIDALAAVGIVAGTGGSRYEPSASVTRAQMATFLARTYAHVARTALPAGRDAFRDDDGNPHEANIDAVVAAGIANGREDGTYGPGEAVRRDQMASFLVRLVRVLESD